MGTSRKGTYYHWHPADAAILPLLPIEGSAIGYHPIAATVAQIRTTLNAQVPEEGQLTTGQVHGRLRAMRSNGMTLTVPVTGAGGSQGWQRTRRGELVYAENTGKRLGGAPELRQIEGAGGEER